MIFKRITFKNFRQFQRTQKIEFSRDPSKNITVVHAENGFGKTTILKGILWALYGHNGLFGPNGEADDFERPDSIINEVEAARCTNKDELYASVELVFSHEASTYQLERKISYRQQLEDPKKSEITLVETLDGESKELDRAQSRIQTIIPEGISRLLFFNGERINYLAMENNSDKVTDAIHQMLGLRLLGTTISDLKHNSVRGTFARELKDLAADELSKAVAKLESLQGNLKDKQEKGKVLDENIKSAKSEKKLIDEKLLTIREIADKQQERSKYEDRITAINEDLQELDAGLAKFISEKGHAYFVKTKLNDAQTILTRLRKEGKVPARVLNTFLQDLLSSSVCICKRPLPEGSAERTAIESLLTIAGNQEFNTAVGVLDRAIGSLETLSHEVQNELNNLVNNRKSLIDERGSLRESIEELNKAIGSHPNIDVATMEENRDATLERIAKYTAERLKCDDDIDEVNKMIEDAKKDFQKAEAASAAEAIAKKRMTALENCTSALEKLLEAETRDLRPILNDEIGKHFSKIIDRDYWPELTEEFVLKVRKEIPVADSLEVSDVGLSTGQRTVTSLVFIASLVAVAARRADIPSIVKGINGAMYPLAIDSPFGSLSAFRRKVAANIADLAPQLLLLVSPEQYNGQVEEALAASKRVGKRYYLAYSGKVLADNASNEIVISGNTYQQYFHCDNNEYTNIVEVSA